MSAMNVLGSRVVLRVVGQVYRRFVVEVQGSRTRVAVTEFVEQGAKVSCFFRRLRGSDNFCLARRERDRRLLLATP
eukprot:3738240-Pleurochrysis_carterae.AAC.1